MLTIYGNDISAPSNKVRFVANLLEIPYLYEHLDLGAGEQRKAEYLMVNPVGKVPAIVDDGFQLFESNAIIKYLADKHDSDLYPRDLQARAVVDQWMDFISLHISLAFSKIFFNRLLAPMRKIPVDENSLAEGLKMLAVHLPIVEEQLTRFAFVVGPNMTLADINLLAILDPAEVVGVDLSVYPHLTKWRHHLQKSDFYQACYPSYAQALERRYKS